MCCALPAASAFPRDDQNAIFTHRSDVRDVRDVRDAQYVEDEVEGGPARRRGSAAASPVISDHMYTSVLPRFELHAPTPHSAPPQHLHNNPIPRHSLVMADLATNSTNYPAPEEEDHAWKESLTATEHFTIIETKTGSKHYKCRRCRKSFWGSASRCYQHLTGDGSDVARCTAHDIPAAVIRGLMEAQSKKRRERAEQNEAAQQAKRFAAASTSQSAQTGSSGRAVSNTPVRCFSS